MIELWTSPTPNGWKVSIMIEELIEAGVELGQVDVRMIDLLKGEQFEADFTERNLNQKIPTLRHDGQTSSKAARSFNTLVRPFRLLSYRSIKRSGMFSLGCTGRLLTSVQFSATNSVIPATWQMCR